MTEEDKEEVKLKPVDIDTLGTDNQNLGYCFLRQVLGATSSYFSDCDAEMQGKWGNAAIKAFQAIKPEDEIESMLAAQMVANHFAAMKCFERASITDQAPEFKDMYYKHATKLSRTYIEQISALNKYRGKGQQKVTVEHIHIHEGGQAIVGNVNSDGGGADKRIKGQAHAQVTHAPEQAMPCQDAQRDSVPVSRNGER